VFWLDVFPGLGPGLLSILPAGRTAETVSCLLREDRADCFISPGRENGGDCFIEGWVGDAGE
jgi:hypothetical protein